MFRPALITASLAALAVAASCSHPTSPTPPSPPQLSRTRFLAFGDSITAGEVTVPAGGVTPEHAAALPLILVPTASYPSVLESRLAARYESQRPLVAVVNAGKPAEAATDAFPRFVDACSAEKPEVVLLLEGYNDLFGLGMAGVTAASDAIGAMAAEARGRGARVFIGTVTPNLPDSRRTIPTALLVAYNERLRAVATREGAVLVDLYSALLGSAPTAIGVDGLHPTEVGYRMMADTFFSSIQANLEVSSAAR